MKFNEEIKKDNISPCNNDCDMINKDTGLCPDNCPRFNDYIDNNYDYTKNNL